MNELEQYESVLILWDEGIGAKEIGLRFGRSRDWVRRIVRKAAKAGDTRAKPHKSGGTLGPEHQSVLTLWDKGIGAKEIGRRFGRSRDWVRRIVRKAAKAGDTRAKPRKNGGTIGAERHGYEPKTRRYYYELEKSRKREEASLSVNRLLPTSAEID